MPIVLVSVLPTGQIVALAAEVDSIVAVNRRVARLAAHAALADPVATLGELVKSLCGVHKKRIDDRSWWVKIYFQDV
jgi:hypothetical protein